MKIAERIYQERRKMGIYWCLVTAVFLAYSFLTGDWGKSWIIWPVAGCVFGAIATFITLSEKRDSLQMDVKVDIM